VPADPTALSRRDALAASTAAAALSLLPRAAHPAPPPADRSGAAEPLVSLADYERAARARMSPMAWEYVSGGAGDELTLGWNQQAYTELRLRTRALLDVSRIDTTLRLFGDDLAHPIILAPTAYHRLMHADGERATRRGAVAARAAMILSSFSTVTLEDVAAAARGTPLWFQLYVQPDRGFTRALVERAQAAGYRALCLTVDTPVLGARNREARAAFHLPDGMTRANLTGLDPVTATGTHRPPEGAIYSAVLEPRLTWRDVEWLRGFATIPVLLKGVMDPDDAARAADVGVAGVIVSNHGARNLDTVPASVTALPRVADRIAGRMPILLDGGIRRGTDVLKALALGATAVAIGRPYLHGLAVDGAAGVERIVSILRTELEMAMALTGKTSLAAIDRSTLWT
jgi:4-hydroxymandelate oxidase